MAYAIVSTVRPNASATPAKPIPRLGKAAARTALPHPPNTSQKVPSNSARDLLVKDTCIAHLRDRRTSASPAQVSREAAEASPDNSVQRPPTAGSSVGESRDSHREYSILSRGPCSKRHPASGYCRCCVFRDRHRVVASVQPPQWIPV